MPEPSPRRGLEAGPRARTLRLTDFDEAELTTQHSPLMSPLVWDLAHIGQQEDLWLLRGGNAAAPGPAVVRRSSSCTTPSSTRAPPGSACRCSPRARPAASSPTSAGGSSTASSALDDETRSGCSPT